MSAQAVFTGDVDGKGRLLLSDETRVEIARHLGTLRNRRVDVRVTVHKDTRSLRANAYYWSCVLAPMAEHSGYTADELHDAMCERFIVTERKQLEFYNRMTGECVTVESDGRRSSKLSTDDFYIFVEQVRQFASEFLGVVTQDPDPEYWRKRTTRRKAA